MYPLPEHPVLTARLHVDHISVNSVFIIKLIGEALFGHNAVGQDDYLTAPATMRIRWAITGTVLFFTRRESAVWIRVSFSTSRLAVASSRRIIGASFKNARAIEMRCRSPPDNAQPFSPIFVFHSSDGFKSV